MRIVREELKNNKGKIIVIPQSFDDLWILLQIISPGDIVFGKTTRRIKQDTEQIDKGERKTVYLGIKVEKTALSDFPNMLRITGVIVQGPDDIPRNTYHTINIRENTKIEIFKEKWTSFALNRLKEAERISTIPPILIVSMDDEVCCFGLVTNYRVSILSKIHSNRSGKRFSSRSTNPVTRTYFGNILKTIKEYLTRYSPEKIVLVGPGFVKTNFKSFVAETNANVAKIMFVENTSVACSNGIYEAIKRGALERVTKEIQIVKETELVDEFITRLGRNEKTVAYGLEQVFRAAEYSAIETLLVTDSALTKSIENYEKIKSIIELVEKQRGKVFVVNSNYDSGAQLDGFGGIAAILRYSLEY